MGAKRVADAVLDAALNYIKNNANKLTVTKTSASTYSKANASSMLAYVAISSGDFTGPNDGSSGGRKIQVNQQASLSVSTTGTAAEVHLLDTTSTAMVYNTTCSSKSLDSTDKVTVPAWTITINDPT